MTQIHVRLADLQTTVARLAEVEVRLAGASRAVDDVPCAGDVGPALAGFAAHWEHGIGTLHRAVGALHLALSDVQQAYTAHERQLVQVLR
jgi:hypothetical protein